MKKGYIFAGLLYLILGGEAITWTADLSTLYGIVSFVYGLSISMTCILFVLFSSPLVDVRIVDIQTTEAK